jgi:acyl-CoA thioester hydrolase
MEDTPWQPLAVTYRGVVYPWQLDQHGRMHVHAQLARFDEASCHLLALLGLGPRSLSEAGQCFVALEQRVSYAKKVGSATAVHIDTELLELGASTLRYRHTLRDSETRRSLAEMERLVALVTQDQRRPAALPHVVARRAQVLFPAAAVHAGTRELELAA